MRPAISRGELVLYYQAQARLRDRVIVGVEALVRWRHPHRGLLPPSAFIPLAERSDVITDLTVWAINDAALRCAAWRREGLFLPIAVNLPARSIADRALIGHVERAIDRAGIDPAGLRLEITESGAMADVERSLRSLKGLRELGVAIAIDDFGTGFSSLAYLARLPISEVKIDRSFVSAMRTDPAAATIVASAVEMCHRLGYSATAEGAEDDETWMALAAISCDVVQGYIVSRPLPPDDLIDHLRLGRWPIPTAVSAISAS